MITMASDAAPTVVNHWSSGIYALTFGLAHHVVEECVVQPECVAEALRIFAFFPLLPVKPPEINSLLLERMNHGVEIGIGPVFVVNAERNRGFAAVWIDVAFRSVVIRSA